MLQVAFHGTDPGVNSGLFSMVVLRGMEVAWTEKHSYKVTRTFWMEPV